MDHTELRTKNRSVAEVVHGTHDTRRETGRDTRRAPTATAQDKWRGSTEQSAHIKRWRALPEPEHAGILDLVGPAHEPKVWCRCGWESAAHFEASAAWAEHEVHRANVREYVGHE